MKLLLMTLIISSYVFAGDKGNGGDQCETYFDQSRSAMKDMFDRNDHTYLELPPKLTYKTYKANFLKKIKHTKIFCVKSNIFLNGAPKTCRNANKLKHLLKSLKPTLSIEEYKEIRKSKHKNKPAIICQYTRFNKLKNNGMLKLVNHEYNQLIGLEIKKQDFDYISSQIGKYTTLELREVIKVDQEDIPVLQTASLILRTSDRYTRYMKSQPTIKDESTLKYTEKRAYRKYEKKLAERNKISIYKCIKNSKCQKYQLLKKDIKSEEFSINKLILLRPGKYFLIIGKSKPYYFELDHKKTKVIPMVEFYLNDYIGKVNFSLTPDINDKFSDNEALKYVNEAVQYYLGYKNSPFEYQIFDEQEYKDYIFKKFKNTPDPTYYYHYNAFDALSENSYKFNNLSYVYSSFCRYILAKNIEKHTPLCNKAIRNGYIQQKELYNLISLAEKTDQFSIIYSIPFIVSRYSHKYTSEGCSNGKLDNYSDANDFNVKTKKYLKDNPHKFITKIKHNFEYSAKLELEDKNEVCKTHEFYLNQKLSYKKFIPSLQFPFEVSFDRAERDAVLLTPGTYKLKLWNELNAGNYEQIHEFKPGDIFEI